MQIFQSDFDQDFNVTLLMKFKSCGFVFNEKGPTPEMLTFSYFKSDFVCCLYLLKFIVETFLSVTFQHILFLL